MLLAEKKKHMAVADKIGHEEYIYRLHGDPSQLPLGAASASRPPWAASGYQTDASGAGGGAGGGDLFASGAGGRLGGVSGPAPIIPSLAPPESLPGILPPVHYPKPPVYFHTRGMNTGLGYASGARLRPLQPPLPSTAMANSYVMAPSNLGISSSLPGFASLPPVNRTRVSATPPLQSQHTYNYNYKTSCPVTAAPRASYSYASNARVAGSGGAEAGMSGVLNWTTTTPNPQPRQPAAGYTGNAYQTRAYQPLPPAPPPGYAYDPADLPPAGKATNRRPMPTYFCASDVPTPSTTPRLRGSSHGLTFQTHNYTDIHR